MKKATVLKLEKRKNETALIQAQEKAGTELMKEIEDVIKLKITTQQKIMEIINKINKHVDERNLTAFEVELIFSSILEKVITALDIEESEQKKLAQEFRKNIPILNVKKEKKEGESSDDDDDVSISKKHVQVFELVIPFNGDTEKAKKVKDLIDQATETSLIISVTKDRNGVFRDTEYKILESSE